MMEAAEAMQRVGAVLDQFVANDVGETQALLRIAIIVGHYEGDRK